MDLNEYQKKALSTDVSGKGQTEFEASDLAFLEQTLGLVGESGEFADKIKKILRDKDGKISNEAEVEIKKELGDVLWYIAVLARYVGADLEDVAKANIKKLADRKKRNVITGSGDSR